MSDAIDAFFGSDFNSKSRRTTCYDFIEKYLSNNVTSWDTPPSTDFFANDFSKHLQSFSDSELAFLICTSGYIPEHYPHDSSQETLYTKLIEVLVCEWALRIGFDKSYIQKQKGSKEDVTLVKDGNIIVCDAKSYRLGRSQAAPNVKDTIKKSDFQKWLSGYPSDKQLGGLITFPSLHAWKKTSDAYLYCTDKEDPIVLLFYEQLSFLLLNKQSSKKLTNIFTEYANLFPSPTKDQYRYFNSVINFLFSDSLSAWSAFKSLSNRLHQEKVAWTMALCKKHLIESRAFISKHADTIPVQDLKAEYIKTRYASDNKEVIRQLDNIQKFRTSQD